MAKLERQRGGHDNKNKNTQHLGSDAPSAADCCRRRLMMLCLICDDLKKEDPKLSLGKLEGFAENPNEETHMTKTHMTKTHMTNTM